jgi:hypothetical protein
MISRRKLHCHAIILAACLACSGAQAAPLRLDCLTPPGVVGGGDVGYTVMVDYATGKVTWFGLLGGNGSLDYALTTDTPADISQTTIAWIRRTTSGDEQVSINRSTGTLYFEQIHGDTITAQCNVYQGAPAPKF